MKDIPVFTTEFGVASLILKEIPYRREAYIRIQTTQQPQELLKECISFCRMCGPGKTTQPVIPHSKDIRCILLLL